MYMHDTHINTYTLVYLSLYMYMYMYIYIYTHTLSLSLYIYIYIYNALRFYFSEYPSLYIARPMLAKPILDEAI